MTKLELLDSLASLDERQQIQWMITLGSYLTIAARNFYQVGTENAEGRPLRGFNEIQHRVHARIWDISNGKEWTLESFIDMLLGNASIYGIDSEVAWALKNSLPTKAK